MKEDVTERGTERKADTTQNEDLSKIEKMIKKQREKEKNLFPMRLNARTIICVTKDNRTVEYADKVRQKLGIENGSR